MQQPYRPPLGTPIKELETPCLLIDLGALEHNIEAAARHYRNSSCKIRPHAKNHRSPHIAHMQIRAGGTVGGVCVSKVAEAEVMVHGGIPSVLLTNQVVAPDKITRLGALCRHADVIVACDDPRNAEALSQGSRAAGVTLGVVIEAETGMRRAGVQSSQQGVDLARTIVRLPALRFRGVMSHQVIAGEPDAETRAAAGREAIAQCLAVTHAIKQAGIPVEIVSTGETWTWDVAPEIPGVTEVQLGSYLLMDNRHTYITEFRIAASVLGRVVSTPRPGLAIGDVGGRALGLNAGMPAVLEPADVEVEAIDADKVALRTARRTHLAVGDTFRLVSGNQDTMVNRWDQYVAVRGRKVEAVWDISARGASN